MPGSIAWADSGNDRLIQFARRWAADPATWSLLLVLVLLVLQLQRLGWAGLT